MNAALFALLTFVLVTILLVSIALLFGRDPRSEAVKARLEAVQRAERRDGMSAELQLVRDELLSDVPALNKFLLKWQSISNLKKYLSQAGVKTKPGKLILTSAVSAFAGYLACNAFVHSRLISVGAGMVAGSVPFVVIAIIRYRRFKAFERLFPEALDLLSRAVRAGHAFTTGMEMIAAELAAPVSSEFKTTFDEQNFGLPFRDALFNLAERVPLLDVRFFVTALLIQKETGGNLAEILDTLARVIRDRFKIQREVKTRTAQGRLSAAILIALPPAMLVALGTLNPHYVSLLFTDPYGPYALVTGFVLQVIGGAVIWKIVSFEV
jgi:tight adherence protein B